jgi:DNA polymerase
MLRAMAEAIAAERMEQLVADIRGCERCGLCKTRTNAVPGEGPIDAKVMFIGEAPGVNEDRQGRPFVGAAGNFLSELLAAAGLRREEVFICNVLKDRPPGNRDPLPDEIAACRPWLDEQIAIIDPLVIVTLGRFSMARYFPRQSISRIHGRAERVGQRFVVPMYHPAAALHQQSLRDTILDDFRALPALIGRAAAEQVARTRTAAEAATATAPAPAAEQIRLFD